MRPDFVREMVAPEIDAPMTKKKKDPRNLRYQQQHFPDADKLIFKPAGAGFVPLPIIMRKVLRRLSLAEVRLLVYLMTRTDKHGICYPTLDDIVYELGLSGRKHLTAPLKGLEEKRFISTKTAAGKRFFLVHDPRVAIEHLAKAGVLNPADLDEIDELFETLGLPVVDRSAHY